MNEQIATDVGLILFNRSQARSTRAVRSLFEN
jgi:hypothetical protein